MHAIALLAALIAQEPLGTIASAEGDSLTYDLGRRIVVRAQAPADLTDPVVHWDLPGGLEEEEQGLSLCLWGLPGRYRIKCTFFYLDPDGRIAKRKVDPVVLTIRGPPGPDPIDPIDPDTVAPTPGDAPFEAPGFAVMVIREAGGAGELPAEQAAIFTDADVKSYLNTKCVDIPGYRGSPFHRTWDDDYSAEQMRNVPDVLSDAYFTVRDLADGQVPYIAISTGSGGYHGPLPGTVEETLALLRRYGG